MWGGGNPLGKRRYKNQDSCKKLMYIYRECFVILVDWNCVLFFTGHVEKL